MMFLFDFVLADSLSFRTLVNSLLPGYTLCSSLSSERRSIESEIGQPPSLPLSPPPTPLHSRTSAKVKRPNALSHFIRF